MQSDNIYRIAYRIGYKPQPLKGCGFFLMLIWEHIGVNICYIYEAGKVALHIAKIYNRYIMGNVKEVAERVKGLGERANSLWNEIHQDIKKLDNNMEILKSIYAEVSALTTNEPKGFKYDQLHDAIMENTPIEGFEYEHLGVFHTTTVKKSKYSVNLVTDTQNGNQFLFCASYFPM